MSGFSTETDRVHWLITGPYLTGELAEDAVILQWSNARIARVAKLLLAYDGMALLKDIKTRRDFDSLEHRLVTVAEKDGASAVLTDLVL